LVQNASISLADLPRLLNCVVHLNQQEQHPENDPQMDGQRHRHCHHELNCPLLHSTIALSVIGSEPSYEEDLRG
jgi:hypothetical protein